MYMRRVNASQDLNSGTGLRSVRGLLDTLGASWSGISRDPLGPPPDALLAAPDALAAFARPPRRLPGGLDAPDASGRPPVRPPWAASRRAPGRSRRAPGRSRHPGPPPDGLLSRPNACLAASKPPNSFLAASRQAPGRARRFRIASRQAALGRLQTRSWLLQRPWPPPDWLLATSRPPATPSRTYPPDQTYSQNNSNRRWS